MKYPAVHYHEYLQLDQILDAQKLKSQEYKRPAHDEMLFITVHQTYELWFKQIIWELDAVLETFQKKSIPDSELGICAARLDRIVAIIKQITGQLDVLETMTPLDFLDFRDLLYPASGFQSYQWRLIETKLGLRSDDRLAFNEAPFYKALSAKQQQEIMGILSKPSLFDAVEKWLERTPFLQAENFNFWEAYKEAVAKMFSEDISVVEKNPRLNDEEKRGNIAGLQAALKSFDALFDEDVYKDLRDRGLYRLSFEALHAAILIPLYRHQPILQTPYRILSALQDIDEAMTNWRSRHALMALRMLGQKIGTGGSSGHKYLSEATAKHKIFGDFFNLTTFFIPSSQIPELPESLAEMMGFRG